MHAIEGIPRKCQILHVEQEVVGDDTTALQCILNSDVERIQLLEEEASLLSQQVLCYVYTIYFLVYIVPFTSLPDSIYSFISFTSIASSHYFSLSTII